MDEGTSAARRPRRRRWYVVGGVTVVSAVLAAGLGFGVSGATSGAQATGASTSTTTAQPKPQCPNGMPMWKCELQTTPQASSSLSPTNSKSATPSPVAVTHTTPTRCGQTFFSATTRAQLTQHFGVGDGCLRPNGSDQWILVYSNMSIGAGPGPLEAAPGGAVVALLDCTSGDTECLDPNATHTFSAFTVYYMPDPQIKQADLLKSPLSPNTHFLTVADCGDYTFDLLNDQWYDLNSTEKKELAAGDTLPSMSAAAPVSGTQALAGSAPSAVPGIDTDC